MIRATKLFSHHGARRFQNGARKLASSTQASSMAAAAAATGTASSSESWSMAIGVAGLSALALGFKTCMDENPSAVAKCENIDQYEDEEESDGKIRVRTIPVSELNVGNDDGGKSKRAFSSALENSLFNTYADGADDWEKAYDDNTVNLLATSNGSEDTLAPPTPADENDNQEVILKRIDTVRSNDLGQNQVYTKKMYFYQSAQVNEFMRNKFSLFALPSSERLGEEMAYLLGTSLNTLSVGAFTDGETSVKIEESIRGKEVFVVCTTTSSNSIMELLLTISALRRGSAKRISVVIPYYGYCRQDRRSVFKREPIAAADMAKLLEEMGVDSVICVDLHNPLVKGFFSPTVPVDHLNPGPVAAAYFYEELFGTGDADDGGDDAKEEKEPKEAPKITVVAAHENQVFRANGFRNALQKLSGNNSDIRVALISNTKALRWSESSESTTIVGDVEGRKCIIVSVICETEDHFVCDVVSA